MDIDLTFNLLAAGGTACDGAQFIGSGDVDLDIDFSEASASLDEHGVDGLFCFEGKIRRVGEDLAALGEHASGVGVDLGEILGGEGSGDERSGDDDKWEQEVFGDHGQKE